MINWSLEMLIACLINFMNKLFFYELINIFIQLIINYKLWTRINQLKTHYNSQIKYKIYF